MNKPATVVVLCTLAIVMAILAPRFFPRYVDAPGGAVDRWTGDTCSTALSVWAREQGDRGPLTCTFPEGPTIQQEYGSTRWR